MINKGLCVGSIFKAFERGVWDFQECHLHLTRRDKENETCRREVFGL